MIISGWVIMIVLLVALIGFLLVYVISNRKWGYTKKRERELENAEQLQGKVSRKK